MATRARRRPAGKPRQILTILLLLLVALYAGIAGTTAWGSPHGKWTPQLGLDLEGGRQITLQPIVGKGQQVNAGEVEQAVNIIRNRVNGNGVSEAQVTTVNKSLIQVSLPGNPSEQTLKSLAQSSQLSFRPVITAQQIAPAQTPTPTPSGSASPSSTPKGSKSPATSGKSTPAKSQASSTGKSTGANDLVPQAFKADTSTPSPSGKDSSSSKATSKPSATSTPTPKPTTPQRQLPGARPTPSSGSDDAWGDFPVDSIWVDNGLATPGETYTELFQAYPCTQAAAPKGKPALKWQEIAAQAPAGQPNVGCDDTEKYLMGPVEVQGKDLTDASYGQSTNQQGVATNQVVVNLKLDGTGAKAFAAVTERLTPYPAGNPKKRFAVTVDGKVITAPESQAVITDGQAQISGNFTESSAKTLANQLKFGALPFSFKELTSNQVSPQVGTDQLQKGILAGLIGLALVVLYSLLQYRALGFVTVASLVVAGVSSYGLVTLLGFTSGFRLTMAGVTGLIVSIGITADSFIVYFERVRDEVRSGRPLRAAVETGWARARRTIIVSDAVNFLAAAVLYVLSEDNVKAFAFTLGLSTLVDIAVVMMFTHPVLTMLARTRFFGSGHKWSGFDPDRLGAAGVTYAGRGRVTIADRKAAGDSTAVEGGHA
ncbi:MAG TPA: protein translocase subunit SecD [Flexivirga sp.]|uniref:protein translocase subunit SecD n=1 Tax=Flexivirga sp. TaxID=1962927 RepID=UPI002CCCD613|nr:protein translocase subunit SecD [Flexivirga sp.]HWC21083.1 protein translocase subunit SecD [Flexivirga sp.]